MHDRYIFFYQQSVMTKQYKTTLVKIMGDEYPIKSDADPEYLRELAKYVEEKIQNIPFKNKLPQRLKSEVLAAIIIADEYFTEKEKNEKIEEKMQQLLDVLEEKMIEEPSQ